MRWRGSRESGNVEDRRGISGGKIAAGGGIGAVVLLVISLLTGQDFTQLGSVFEGGSSSSQQQTTAAERGPRADDDMASFVKVVLASTEDVWTPIFQQQLKMNYRKPGLVMFTNSTQSGCGGASSAMGPFYCPADEKVYIDLSFCDQLKNQFHAPGEFAVAYVVAHEVGHHIQKLIGLSDKMERARAQLSETEYNKLSVKLELQADFLAGCWAYYSNKQKNWLDPSDLESALTAANAIGDDKLQKQAQGYIVPDAFTHGTSQQRMYWFKKGFETGDLSQGRFEDIR